MAEVRDLIKTKFLENYRKKPLSKIKVSQLAEECAISRGAFYFYFPDIESVYHECEDDVLDRMLLLNEQINLSTLRRDFETHVHLYKQNLENYKSMKDELKVFFIGSETISFRIKHVDHIAAHYGVAMRYSEERDETKRACMTDFFSAGLDMILCKWIINDCITPVEKLAEVIASATFTGLFP